MGNIVPLNERCTQTRSFFFLKKLSRSWKELHADTRTIPHIHGANLKWASHQKFKCILESEDATWRLPKQYIRKSISISQCTVVLLLSFWCPLCLGSVFSIVANNFSGLFRITVLLWCLCVPPSSPHSSWIWHAKRKKMN